MPPLSPHRTQARPRHSPSDRLDAALLSLASGRRRPLLELARDVPGVVAGMAAELRLSPEAVAHDLSMLHAAEFEERTEELTARYDGVLRSRSGIGPGSRALDVGCGAGGFTLGLARTAASVVGIDVAAALIARARERARAEGMAGATFAVGDAATHPFEPASFDAVVSRFGAMYFGHPVPAFANLARALRPGGRLALVAWRELGANQWMSLVGDALAAGRPLPDRPPGDPGAFGLADEGAVRAVLAGAGFADVVVEAVDEPVVLGPGAGAAFDFVSTLDLSRRLLEGLEGADRRAALARLRALLVAHETPAGVLLGSGAWVVTARRP